MLILNIVLKKIIISEHCSIPVFKAVSRWNDMKFVLGGTLLCDLSITLLLFILFYLALLCIWFFGLSYIREG